MNDNRTTTTPARRRRIMSQAAGHRRSCTAIIGASAITTTAAAVAAVLSIVFKYLCKQVSLYVRPTGPGPGTRRTCAVASVQSATSSTITQQKQKPKARPISLLEVKESSSNQQPTVDPDTAAAPSHASISSLLSLFIKYFTIVISSRERRSRRRAIGHVCLVLLLVQSAAAKQRHFQHNNEQYQNRHHHNDLQDGSNRYTNVFQYPDVVADGQMSTADDKNYSDEEELQQQPDRSFLPCPSCVLDSTSQKLSLEYSRAPSPHQQHHNHHRPENRFTAMPVADENEKERKVRERDEKDARLEAIKHQILLKLGLKKKPNVTHAIPKQFILDTLYRVADNHQHVMHPYEYAATAAIISGDEQPVHYATLDSGGGPQIFKLLDRNQQNGSGADFNDTASMYHPEPLPLQLQPSYSRHQANHTTRTEQHNDNSNGNTNDDESEFDDFYGRTREIISFAERGK